MKQLMIAMSMLLALNASGVFAAEKKVVKPASPVVEIKTSMGNMKVELYPDKAPKTVKNFLAYVKENHYKGTIFHRVINGFMIQGGGFDKALNKKEAKAPIKNEAANGLGNKRGTIAMARTNVIDSATDQFFINHKDNNFLDYRDERNYGYCVFGKVISGMDVLDKIAKVQTTSKKYYRNVPETPVIIREIVRIK